MGGVHGEHVDDDVEERHPVIVSPVRVHRTHALRRSSWSTSSTRSRPTPTSHRRRRAGRTRLGTASPAGAAATRVEAAGVGQVRAAAPRGVRRRVRPVDAAPGAARRPVPERRLDARVVRPLRRTADPRRAQPVRRLVPLPRARFAAVPAVPGAVAHRHRAAEHRVRRRDVPLGQLPADLHVAGQRLHRRPAPGSRPLAGRRRRAGLADARQRRRATASSGPASCGSAAACGRCCGRSGSCRSRWAWRGARSRRASGTRSPRSCVGLTCAFHFITGYLVLLALGVFVLVHPPQALKRLGRGALVGIGGAADLRVHLRADARRPQLRQRELVPGATPSGPTRYGPDKVFTWLFDGRIFDFGRHPVVSRARRDRRARVPRGGRAASETARVPLGLMVLSLLCTRVAPCGRTGARPVARRLRPPPAPLHHRCALRGHAARGHRCRVGVPRRGARRAVRAPGPGPDADRRRWSRACSPVCVMWPVLVDREHYADYDTALHHGAGRRRQRRGRRRSTRSSTSRSRRGGGRVYAGLPSNWGGAIKVDQVDAARVAAAAGRRLARFHAAHRLAEPGHRGRTSTTRTRRSTTSST